MTTINEISLSANGNKIIQSTDSLETYLYRTKKIIHEKRRNQMYQYNKRIQKTINYANVKKENIREHNPNWPQILNHS